MALRGWNPAYVRMYVDRRVFVFRTTDEISVSQRPVSEGPGHW